LPDCLYWERKTFLNFVTAVIVNGLLTGDVTGAAGSIVVYDAAATDGVNVGVFAGKQ